MPSLVFELGAGAPEVLVCGVDEVGRSPLAGPVVAAAVCLVHHRMPVEIAARVDDSKLVAKPVREEISAALTAGDWALWAVGEASVAEIDAINILQASHLAMRRAVAALPAALMERVDDSKVVPRPVREEISAALTTGAWAWWGVGEASVEEIDDINILQASHLAMRRAVAALGCAPVHALVDGKQCPGLPIPRTLIVGGDGLSLSIACASIVAKVHRDRLMHRLAEDHPGYGWETNVGYPTRAHREALKRQGPTPHHRRSFAPVAACC